MSAPMSDTEVLNKAQRLLDKYFHPSRSNGRVPSGSGLGDAKALLRLAETRARREESAPRDFSLPPGEVPQWPGI